MDTEGVARLALPDLPGSDHTLVNVEDLCEVGAGEAEGLAAATHTYGCQRFGHLSSWVRKDPASYCGRGGLDL